MSRNQPSQNQNRNIKNNTPQNPPPKTSNTNNTNNDTQNSTPLGFGHKDRVDEINLNNGLASDRIWKKLFQPENTHVDPNDPSTLKYHYCDMEAMKKQQMARRMDRKVIKLEIAFGHERDVVLFKRDYDLTARDIMEDIQAKFKIPLNEQVIYYKGINLCEHAGQTLESLGVENNNHIRIFRESDPNRLKAKQGYPNEQSRLVNQHEQARQYNQSVDRPSNKSSEQMLVNSPRDYNDNRVSNVPSQQNNEQFPRDILKLYVTYGSDREYVIIHGRKPLMLHDLKMELMRLLKIPFDKQCIVFKGYHLHEFLEDTPLDAFGLENNNPITVWYKSDDDVKYDQKLPTGPNVLQDIRQDTSSTQASTIPRWIGPNTEAPSSEVVKCELIHGSDRYQLILKGHERNLIVMDLQNEVFRLTFVPIENQRIFYRGQELSLTPNKSLREFDLQNNCVIKVIGEAVRNRYINYGKF